MIFLCRVADLQATGARGVTLGEGEDELDIVVAETNGARHAFVDCCPHQNIPLETFPHHFFAPGGKHLVCSGHGALFAPDTGLCVKGPCEGRSLRALKTVEKDGEIYLAEDRTPEEIAREEKAKRRW